MVLGLGAYPTPVPHTRTPLLARLGVERGARPGPRCRTRSTSRPGCRAMIERRAALRGMPALGLWAQVPHYVSAMPYPAASLALLEAANRVAGLDLPLGDLPRAADASRTRIDELIAQNPEHTAMLEQLEAQADQRGHRARSAPGHERRRAGRRARALPPGERASSSTRAGQASLGSRGMKVDGGIGEDRRRLRSRSAGRRTAKAQEDAGLRRAVDGRDRATTRSSRCCSRRRRTERVELGTGDRRRLRPQPDEPGADRLGPAGGVRGPVHPRPRQPDQAAHHQALLDAVVAPGRPHARDDPGDPRHLGVLERRHQARLPAATSTPTR